MHIFMNSKDYIFLGGKCSRKYFLISGTDVFHPKELDKIAPPGFLSFFACDEIHPSKLQL